jgi:hypothetical protein
MPAAAAPTTRHPPSVRNKGAGWHLLHLSSSIMTALGLFRSSARRFSRLGVKSAISKDLKEVV